MKKLVKLLLVLLLFPILVKATKYSETIVTANYYNKQFLYPNRYFVEATLYWDLYDNMNPKKVGDGTFNQGGLITAKEVEITTKGNDNVAFSYMYDGTKFWALNKYVIGEEIEYKSDTDAQSKTKVTEFVKHDTQVTGIGTFENPYLFIDSYRVTVKAIGRGKVDGETSITKPVVAHGRVTFAINGETGYKYLNHTCGNSASCDGSILTIENVEKDFTCEVTFSESKNRIDIPLPKFKVNTELLGETEYTFTNGPYPTYFYYKMEQGYYSNEELTIMIGKLRDVPHSDGWTFRGYFVGSDKIIYGEDESVTSDRGKFEPNGNVIKVESPVLEAKATRNTYTITYDKQTGTGGTCTEKVSPNGTSDTSCKVMFVDDLPTITIPTKTGYTFNGYFTGEGGTGTQYYDGTGNAVNVWLEPRNTTLYAYWTPNTYTITFNGNGNDGGSTADATCTYDANCTLTTNGFTKTGFHFTGWSFGSNTYNDGQAVLNLTAEPNGIITMTANWIDKCSSITYVNGTTCTVSCGGGTYNRVAYSSYDSTYRCPSSDLSSGGSACNTGACCTPQQVIPWQCCTDACAWYCCPDGSKLHSDGTCWKEC